MGHAARDLGLWADDGERKRFETELARTGTVKDFEARLRVKGGDDIECLVSAETITLSDRACIL